MASGKETPRQKMIGLMYLVLMAMLALNVSKDILESFVQVNTSLESSANNSTLKNEELYADFGIANQLDAARVQPFFEKATSARSKTTDLIQYIETLKRELMKETDGVTDEVADTLTLEYVNAKDNFDVTTNIMIGMSEDGSDGKSAELRAKIEQYKTELLALLTEEQANDARIGLEFEGTVKDGQALNWEMHTFYHTTLAGAIVNLSKLQNDIKNAEYEVMNKLYAEVGDTDMIFDTVAPKIVAPTNYVLLGEEYNADIFLAAFNKTKNPKITINEEEIPVQSGLGTYSLKTNKEGFHNYSGVIEVETTKGEKKQFPFESNYIVARPAVTVSPTKMNVLYVGLNNPVSISVPGVANENVRAKVAGSGNTIRRTGNGEYEVKMAKNASSNTSITVSAEMPDGTIKVMGKMDFRVKRVPKPQTRVAGKMENGKMKKGNVVQLKTVLAHYEDFLFDIKANVTSFKLWIPGTNDLKSNSNRFSDAMKSRLRSLKVGDVFAVQDVRAKLADGRTVSLNSITFEVGR